MNELGTVLGVRFAYEPSQVNGFLLELTDVDTDETLFSNRMIFYTLWEAVIKACWEVWDKEIQKTGDDDLPARIATALNIEETYEEDDE